jgi:hypothetical protein
MGCPSISFSVVPCGSSFLFQVKLDSISAKFVSGHNKSTAASARGRNSTLHQRVLELLTRVAACSIFVGNQDVSEFEVEELIVALLQLHC